LLNNSLFHWEVQISNNQIYIVVKSRGFGVRHRWAEISALPVTVAMALAVHLAQMMLTSQGCSEDSISNARKALSTVPSK
jgi:hypothetical protein